MPRAAPLSEDQINELRHHFGVRWQVVMVRRSRHVGDASVQNASMSNRYHLASMTCIRGVIDSTPLEAVPPRE